MHVDTVYKVYGMFLNAGRLNKPPLTFFGGSRRRRVMFAVPVVAIRMKAMIRMVHGNLYVNVNVWPARTRRQ